MYTGEQIVQRVTAQDKDLKMSSYISEGFDLIKDNLWLFIAFFILMNLATSVVELIPYIGQIINFIFISPVFNVGFFLAFLTVHKKEELEFNRFFDGFQYIGPLALQACIFMLAFSIFLVPMGMMFFIGSDILIQGLSGPYGIAGLIIISIPILYIMICWLFSSFFIVFYDLGAWEAMETSRKIISKKWFSFFLFTLLVFLVAVSGVLGFLILLLYTVPAAYAAVFCCFRDLVGFPGDEQEDVFGDFS